MNKEKDWVSAFQVDPESCERGLASQRVMNKKKDWASVFQGDTEGLERRMYSNICCPESQHGHQPLQSCGFFLRGRNDLFGNLRANVFEYSILSGKSMWRSTHFPNPTFQENKDEEFKPLLCSQITTTSRKTLIFWNRATLAKNVFYIKMIRRNVRMKIYLLSDLLYKDSQVKIPLQIYKHFMHRWEIKDIQQSFPFQEIPFPTPFSSKEHVFYCDSPSRPNFFKPWRCPLLENPINIAVGRTSAIWNALMLLPMCLVCMGMGFYDRCKSYFSSVDGAHINLDKNLFFTSMNFDVGVTISLLVKS